MRTVAFNVTFELLECGGCGIQFAVPSAWKRTKVAEHGSFKCPNGCSRQFVVKTDIEIAQAETLRVQAALNDERQRRIVKEREFEKLRTEKERLEKRISNGACPCCNRSFVNLQRHMRTKHPEKVIGAGSVKAIA